MPGQRGRPGTAADDYQGELGTHETTRDGKVVRAKGQCVAGGQPMAPPMVETLVAGGRSGGAYWEQGMGTRQKPGARAVKLGINDLVNRMLAQSNQLKASSDTPLIRDTVVTEAKGRFDTFVFADGDYEKTDNPRSSLLETGTSSTAPDTLNEESFGIEVGVGQPLLTGGEVRVAQGFGSDRSNSEFFVPSSQTNAGLRFEVRQPLLEGAGIAVNSAPVQLAKLERDRSIADFQRQIEDQFSEVVRAYWTLYAERSRVLQARRRIAGDSGSGECESALQPNESGPARRRRAR